MWTLTELRNPLLRPLLRQIIDRRLARLHRTTRDALAIAAIISEQPDLKLWSAVSGQTDEQLANVGAEATEAHVLVERSSDSVVRFITPSSVR